MSVQDGGWAFPRPNNNDQNGMTLRDYFAGQVIGALIASATEDDKRRGDADPDDFLAWFGEGAYRIADAMLEERVKESP